MLDGIFKNFQKIKALTDGDPSSSISYRGSKTSKAGNQVKILKKGSARRVIFFYPGEEGTYVDNAEVTLYENGIIHLQSSQEESTTHLQNCEILWRFELDGEDRANKVRLLKPKSETRISEDADCTQTTAGMADEVLLGHENGSSTHSPGSPDPI